MKVVSLTLRNSLKGVGRWQGGSMKCENVSAKWIGTIIVWLSYVFPCGEEVGPA